MSSHLTDMRTFATSVIPHGCLHQMVHLLKEAGYGILLPVLEGIILIQERDIPDFKL